MILNIVLLIPAEVITGEDGEEVIIRGGVVVEGIGSEACPVLEDWQLYDKGQISKKEEKKIDKWLHSQKGMKFIDKEFGKVGGWDKWAEEQAGEPENSKADLAYEKMREEE